VPSLQTAREPAATAVEPLGSQGVPHTELCRHGLGLLGGLVNMSEKAGLSRPVGNIWL